ncbi:MAG: hypothetical protein ACYDEB_12725 [Dehalococcoidia bacterium]
MVNNIMLSAMAWASSLKNAVAMRINEERGQDLLEYAVLAGAIGIAAAAAFIVVGGGWLNFAAFKSKVGACVSFSSTCGS